MEGQVGNCIWHCIQHYSRAPRIPFNIGVSRDSIPSGNIEMIFMCVVVKYERVTSSSKQLVNVACKGVAVVAS